MELDWLNNLDSAKFLWGAIIAPVLGWLGYFVRAMWKRKRRKEFLVNFLSGLPLEAKSVLIDFYQEGTHTMRGNPYSPAVSLLVERGIVTRGPGAGGYSAANSYLSIRPDIWEVMHAWVVTDPFVFGELFPEVSNDSHD